MKILYILDSQFAWKNGCWFYRVRVPATELRSRGHEIKLLTLGRELKDDWLEFPDVVVYGRGYGIDPIPSMEKFKEAGAKIVYDLDDDVWSVNPDNPSNNAAVDRREQIEGAVKIADVVTTPSKILQKKLKKLNKNVVFCPNALDFGVYKSSPENEPLRIGFFGGATHWGDLGLVLDPLIQLQKEYGFMFILGGMTKSPLIDDIYSIRQIVKQGAEPERREYHKSVLDMFEKLRKLEYVHIPWHSPELYPSVLSDVSLDIGVAPLKDNEFNHSKSALKFYEYAAIGIPTIASKVSPYKEEVGYCAKNNFSDWYKKLETLLKFEDFRMSLWEKQIDFVKSRDIKVVVEDWEKAFK